MAQFSRPISDVDMSGWTCSTGTDKYALIDESVANDDTDYIWRSATHILPTDSTVGMSVVSDPLSSSGHVMRFRARLESAGSCTLQCDWVDTGSIVTTQNFTVNSTSYQDFSYTLSGAEADAIVNYGGMKLYVLARDGGGVNCRLTFAEFEVPDAGTARERRKRGFGK